MRIAVIGTGRMGAVLGARLAGAGHEVRMGSRAPDRGRARATEVGAARGGGYRDVLPGADVAILAVPWAAARETLLAFGDLDRTILVDVTNPFPETSSGGSGKRSDSSGAEQLQAAAPRARLVKAFNTLSSALLRKPPDFAGTAPTIFVAGDDGAAKDAVAGLVACLGYEPVDAGALSSARYLESLAGLMITLDRLADGRTEHALELLRRPRAVTQLRSAGRAEKRLGVPPRSTDRPRSTAALSR
ncbi:MAG: NADPH-dependent F420 reductase [Verrucomicrobiota bacterium]